MLIDFRSKAAVTMGPFEGNMKSSNAREEINKRVLVSFWDGHAEV